MAKQNQPNQHGKRRTAELLRAICRVGDRETWEARVDDNHDPLSRLIQSPRGPERRLIMNEPCNNTYHMVQQICPDCGACASHIGDRIDGTCRHCGSKADPTSQHRDPHSGVWVDGR